MITAVNLASHPLLSPSFVILNAPMGTAVANLRVRVSEDPASAIPWVLAVALIARIAGVVLTPDYAPVFDSGDYARHATSIAHGFGFPESLFTVSGGPTAFRPPLYPYALGGVYAVFGDGQAGETAGRVLGAMLGTAAVYLVWLVAARTWRTRVGLIAAGVAAVFPPLVLLNDALITEPLFLTIELAIVLTALVSRDRGGDWRWAAACGALCSLAALTRSNGILLMLPAAAGVWVAKPRFSRSGLLAPVALALAAVITIVPWTIRNSDEFDRFVPFSTQTGFGMAGIFNDAARDYPGYPGTWIVPQRTARYKPIFAVKGQNEAELDSSLRGSAGDYARDHLGYFVEATVLNTLRTLNLAPADPLSAHADEEQLGIGRTAARLVQASWYLAILLGILGAIALIRRPRDLRGPLFIWVVPVLLLLAATWVIASTRYRAPVYPMAAMLIAIGIHDFAPRLGRRSTGELRDPGETENA